MNHMCFFVQCSSNKRSTPSNSQPHVIAIVATIQRLWNLCNRKILSSYEKSTSLPKSQTCHPKSIWSFHVVSSMSSMSSIDFSDRPWGGYQRPSEALLLSWALTCQSQCADRARILPAKLPRVFCGFAYVYICILSNVIRVALILLCLLYDMLPRGLARLPADIRSWELQLVRDR